MHRERGLVGSRLTQHRLVEVGWQASTGSSIWLSAWDTTVSERAIRPTDEVAALRHVAFIA